MTRPGWLYVGSGVLLVASLILGVRCLVLAKPKPKGVGRDVEQRLVELTNSSRQTEGLGKLQVHPALTDVAREYAKKISKIETDWTKPLSEQWKPSDEWMAEQLRSSGYGWPVMRIALLPQMFSQAAFEGRRVTVPEAFARWLEEDRSKAQPAERGILNPYVHEIGVGVYHDDATGFDYVGFVFAKRFRSVQMEDLFKPKEKDKDKDKDNPNQ